MLKAGKTPEDLYKEIHQAQREINAEKEKADKLEKTRDKLVEAAIEHTKALYGKDPDPKQIEIFINRLKAEENQANTPMSDDAKLRKFLDSVWMTLDAPWGF